MSSPSCISCGYSLSGLAREALCPECAFPIARSLDATPLLRTAEPRWLARIASGLRALNLSMTCWMTALALWVVSMFVGIVVMKGVGGTALDIAMKILIGLLIAASTAGFLSAAYGFWSIGALTPSFHAPRPWARLVVRYLAASLALVAVALAALSAISTISVLGTPAAYALRGTIQGAGLLSLLAFSRILEHFERSFPVARPDLDKRIRSTRTSVVVLALVFLIGWGQTMFGAARTSLPLGFAPLLLTIGLLSFERTIRHVHKGVAAELAAARGEGGVLKPS